jgi:hypothetical protein
VAQPLRDQDAARARDPLLVDAAPVGASSATDSLLSLVQTMSDLQDRIDALVALYGDHAEENALVEDDLVLTDRNIGKTNKVFEVEDGHGTVVAAFKPRNGFSINWAKIYGQTRVSALIAEAVTWQTAKLLGAPYDEIVAPCVLREFDGQKGALIRWRPGSAPDARAYQRGRDQVMSAALFDALIGQQDRNDANYLWDPALHELALIDHSYCFAVQGQRRANNVFLAFRHAQGEDTLTDDEHDALEVFAGSGGSLAKIEACLEPNRGKALHRRVEYMIQTRRLLGPCVYDPYA